jgi:hypothetical protein
MPEYLQSAQTITKAIKFYQMKKLILLSLFCLATNTLLRGQIAKGTILNNRWGANWFLTPHLAFDIGLDLRYNLGTNVEGFTHIRSFDGPRGDRGFPVGTSIGVQYFLQRGN